jgi:AraC-like DNA-binding protein
MALPTEGLIEVPFAQLRQVESSIRYDWNNALRGDDPFVMLQFTERGEGCFEFGGIVRAVPRHHVFIGTLPETSRYFYPASAREPWVFSWINFYGELSLRLWRELRDHAGPVLQLQPSAIRLFHRLVTRTSGRTWTDPYETSKAAYNFYLEVLRQLPKPAPAQPFHDAVLHLQTRYQKVIRMKEVAAQAGMSREHFTRLFTTQMGEPPAAFLRRIRLEAAARLLRTTDLPRAEIAFRSGWPSPAKLDFFFKRHHGVSPKVYRQRHGSRPA